MVDTKGKKLNLFNKNYAIHTVHAILSEISKSKFSNQSDSKVLRHIKLIELSNRLSSCLDQLEKYGEITSKDDSFRHQLQMIRKTLKKDINLMEFPIDKDGHWFGNQTFAEISAHEFRNIGKKDIRERRSLGRLLWHCQTLLLFNENSKIKMTDDEKREYNIYEYLITGKAWEALGYWRAKLENMKRNKENVKKRTTQKEKRKAEVNEWMKTMKPQEVRLKAQQVFGVTERTVLKWLQEIRDEKTAFLRKKDVSA